MRQALRCTVLKQLTNQSYRSLSAALARTPLYRWFCGCPDFEVVRVPGESTLQDYTQWLPEEDMQKLLAVLHSTLANEDKAYIFGKPGSGSNGDDPRNQEIIQSGARFFKKIWPARE